MLVDNRMIRSIFTIIASTIMLAPVTIFAQDGAVLEEIVVTATMRNESLQDVPISISVVSDEDIQSIGAYRLQDLTGIIPSINVAEGQIDNDIAIRGIGSGSNQGFEQSVGIFRDGVYTGRATLSRLPFLDVSAIEVVRGPQGVLFGRSTIAGAITMRSNRPTEEVEIGGRTQIALDEDQDYELEGFVSGPLSDALGARLAMRYRDSEGYVFNEATGDNLPETDEYALRGTLEWDVTNDLSATLRVEHSDWENNGRPFEIMSLDTASGFVTGGFGALLSPTNVGVDFVTNITNSPNRAGAGGTDLGPPDDFPGFVGTDRENDRTNADAQVVNLKLEAQFGDYRVESTTGYAAYDYFAFVDGESSPLPFITNVQTESYEQVSQELRLLSPEERRFNWVAGLYYESNDYRFNEEIDILPFMQKFATDFDQDEEDISVFGQLNFYLTDSLSATGGVRYTNTKKDGVQVMIVADMLPIGNLEPAAVNRLAFAGIIPHTNAGNRSEDRLDWSFSLEQQFAMAGEHTAYFTISRGSKAGGFDARAQRPSRPGASVGGPGAYEYNEETALAYEVGLKSVWLDGSLRWNWALYHSDFEDLQESVFDGIAGFNVQNAPEVRVRGFETDLILLATEGLTLWGNLGYVDNQITAFEAEPNRIGDVPSIAEITGAAGFRFRRPITASLDFLGTLTLTYRDGTNQDPSGFLNRPQYDLDATTELDFQVGVGSNNGKWSINLLGTNVTDEVSCSFVGNVTFSNGAAPVCAVNPPQTFYLQANYNY